MKHPVCLRLALSAALAGASATAFAETLSTPPASEGPVEPLPATMPANGTAGTSATAGTTTGAPTRTPVPALPANTRQPSLLDPLPGSPGGAPLPPSPVTDEEAAPLEHRLTLHAAVSERLGEGPKNVPPRLGFGLGATFGRKVWEAGAPGSRLSLWGTLDLFHDRFSGHDSVVEDTDLGPVTVSVPRLLSQTSFVFLPVVALELGRFSPWVGAGLGFSLGYFHSAAPAYQPGDLTAHELIGRVAFGLDVSVRRRWSVGARVGLSSAIWPNEPRLGGQAAMTEELTALGPWAEAGLNLQFRF